MSQFDDTTNKQFRILRIITWAMLVVAPLIYLHVAWRLDTQGIQASVGNDVMLYLLLILAAIEPAFVLLIVRIEIGKYRSGATKIKSPAHLFLTLGIIQMAFVTTIYVYGLIVFILTGKFTYMLYFYPIGIAWSFVYWPRREKYTQLLEKLNQP